MHSFSSYCLITIAIYGLVLCRSVAVAQVSERGGTIASQNLFVFSSQEAENQGGEETTGRVLAPKSKSSKAPVLTVSKVPSIKSSKAPKTSKAPSIKSSKAPSIKSSKAPTTSKAPKASKAPSAKASKAPSAPKS